MRFCAARAEPVRRYKGPYLSQLSLDVIEQPPKPWPDFLVGSSAANNQMAYNLPSHTSMLMDRLEENLVFFLVRALMSSPNMLPSSENLVPSAAASSGTISRGPSSLMHSTVTASLMADCLTQVNYLTIGAAFGLHVMCAPLAPASPPLFKPLFLSEWRQAALQHPLAEDCYWSQSSASRS